MRLINAIIILFVLGSISVTNSIAQTSNGAEAISLHGSLGRSSKWGVGWLDLDSPIDFEPGDKLRLIIGGSANTVLVRLLPKNHFPDRPVGIVSKSTEVPSDRIVEIDLIQSYRQIIQISVHGGEQAWHYSLGYDNGPAILESAEYIRP